LMVGWILWKVDAKRRRGRGRTRVNLWLRTQL
jgi:hypothetical protein